MTEVKTAELVGAALDWAVAKASSVKLFTCGHGTLRFGPAGHRWCPSTDWSQGGPLIEKYKLDIGAPMETRSGPWVANTEWGHPLGHKGDTPLIAACRAIVAATLGDVVSVPAELVNQ